MDFMNFITENGDTILVVLTSIVAAASAVANVTPNETDNKIVATLSKVVNFLALNLKKK